MDRSDNPNDRDDPTGGIGPRESSDAARKWLDNILPPGERGPESASDPIARNPKDIGTPGEAVQATEVRRRSAAPVSQENMTLPSGPSGGGHPHFYPGPSMMDLVVSTLRFKWTILIIWILVSGPIIAAVWTQIVPKYAAKAEVRVRPIIPRLVFRTEDNGTIPFYESFVNTQVSVIRGQTVLQRVLDQPEIQKTIWYRNPPKALMERVRGIETPALERLRDGLVVRPRPRTEIIDVSFEDSIAQDAKLIVDVVLGQYMKYIGEQSNETEDKLYRELTAQYNSLEGEIKLRETTCSKLSKDLGTDAPQELISSRRILLDQTEARLEELRTRIALLQERIKRAASDSNGVSAAPGVGRDRQSKYYEDAEWCKLDLEVKRIEYMIATSIQGPNHPGRKRSESEWEFAKKLRQERQAQLDELWQERQKSVAVGALAITPANGPGVEAGVMTPEDQLGLARQEEQRLSAALEKQKADFDDLFVRAQLLEREATELQHRRELYNAVRQRLDQKNIERNVPASISVSQVYSPTRPTNDRRMVFTIMGLFAGLGLGAGVAFLRASTNQTIYAPGDMPQPAQAPFLGLVPLVHLRKPLGKALCDEIEQKQVLLTESVRVLRTALLSRLKNQGCTTVVVTSASEGTGKSSFSIVLGKSIAQAGRKVLIIDADFHKMTLSKRLGLVDKPGFREFLQHRAHNSLCISPSETAGLDIMPGGTQSNGDVVLEEIANGAFRSGMGRLREEGRYDIILLDTPPILPVADAAILAGQVDGVIMVEREHVSRRTEVTSALVRLNATGGRLLGTVFVGSADHDHYGYGYGYGYGRYGHRAKES